MNKSIYIYLFCLAPLLYSCSPVMYSNVGYNVPLFHEKGEVNISGGYSESHNPYSTDFSEGLNFNFATALTDHLLIQTSYYNHWYNSSSTDYWSGRGSYLELGAGHYTAWGKDSLFVVEFTGGMGLMNIKNEKGPSYIETQIFKPYIQPAIGISHRIVEFAFAPRISFLSYLKDSYSLSNGEERFEAENFFDEKNNLIVLEPGFILKLGINNVKLSGQLGFSTFRYQSNVEDFEPFLNNYVAVGLNVMLTDRFLKYRKS